jgi:hypothetical protein
VGNLALQNFMNNFGAATVLAVTTGYRIDSIMILPIINMGAAISSLVARSKGEEDPVKIRSYMKNGLVLMIGVSILLGVIMFFFGKGFISFFGITGDALVIGDRFFKDLAAFYILFGVATVLRSVLEGVTMNLAIVLDILKTQVDIDEIMVVGGGAKGRVWRQIMADVYNTKIVVPTVLEEAGSMGAAVIGGVGAGIYKDFDAIENFLEIADVQMPNPAAVEAYKPVRELFDDCYFALEKVYSKMN